MQFNRDDLNFFYRYCIALTRNEAISYDLLQTALEKWLRKSIHSKSGLRVYRNNLLVTLADALGDTFPFKDKTELDTYLDIQKDLLKKIYIHMALNSTNINV